MSTASDRERLAAGPRADSSDGGGPGGNPCRGGSSGRSWRERARELFGDALDLDAVRFRESVWARVTGRAFVIHDTVRWPRLPVDPPTTGEMATIVHELVHCWQHQSGEWQLSRGILEQTLYTLFGWWLAAAGVRPLYDPYDYGGPEGLARAHALRSFRLEAQARIVEHYWLARWGGAREVGGHAVVDGAGEPTAFAENLVRLCRGAGLR